MLSGGIVTFLFYAAICNVMQARPVRSWAVHRLTHQQRLMSSTKRTRLANGGGYKRDLSSAQTSTPTHMTHSEKSLGLAASRLGLDPALNRFHAPLVYHENYSFSNWPEKHTFPMDKFARTAHALLHTCKRTHAESPLPRPLVRLATDFFRPFDHQDVPREWLSGPIDEEFVNRFLLGQLSKEECRHIGFREQTSRPELIERTLNEVAGTVLASQLALHYGIAANVAGGTHHASPITGAGYTILNDLAVATHVLTSGLLNGYCRCGGEKEEDAPRQQPLVKRVLIIDCDVHQGDGTAKFGNAVLKDKLFTLSLHCDSNYPCPKAQSTFDVGLPDGMRDDEYMAILEKSVNHAIQVTDPDLVLYDAGVDIFEDDRLGRLKVSEQGIRRRDRWVLDRCVSAGIPVAAVVGGGYDKDVDALARRHAIVHEECGYVWRKHRMWERVQPY